MKKTLIFAAALLACACSTDKYTIQGNIEGAEGYLYLSNGETVIDSTAVKEGAFRFEGKATTPQALYLTDNRDLAQATFLAPLFIEPGDIRLGGTPEAPFFTGTPANDGYATYTGRQRALLDEYRNPATAEERRAAIEQEYDALNRECFAANGDNLFGAVLLNDMQYDLTGAELLEKIAAFPQPLQQAEMLVKLHEQALKKSKTDPGQPYINIIQCNPEREIVSLSSVLERPEVSFVLVDFWASWCGPCMGEVPYLKQAYAAYHDRGFEIYGVSFDNNEQKWLDAIRDNGMNWVHVSDLNGFDNPAARDYAVQGIPSNFLLDKKGTILATNLRGEALAEKLAELFDGPAAAATEAPAEAKGE